MNLLCLTSLLVLLRTSIYQLLRTKFMVIFLVQFHEDFNSFFLPASPDIAYLRVLWYEMVFEFLL